MTTTMIRTCIYKVNVRLREDYTLLCEKFFFTATKRDEFVEKLNGIEQIDTICKVIIMEDSLTYTEED